MGSRQLVAVKQRLAEGISAWERQDYETALDVFEALVEAHPGFADVHNRRGLCLAMLDRGAEAVKAFERALELNPSYAEAHLNRGIVLMELGREAESLEALDEASRLDTRDGLAYPSSVGHQLAAGHGHLGDLYRVAGRVDLAVEHYRQGLAIRPRYLDIRARLADVLIELDRPEEAREELSWVLQENPSFTGARVRLGLALHHLGDLRGAIREWRRCVRDDPGDLRARAYLTSVGSTPSEVPGDPEGPPA